jgi:DNA primase
LPSAISITRGFGRDIIQKFQIGYNLEIKDDLTRALLQNQFNLEYAQKSGLVVVRMKLRWIIIAAGLSFPFIIKVARSLLWRQVIKTNDKAPKYINTPENEIYVKSKILYGTYFARQAINKFDECLLVEGYTDVVSLHQAGIENVVASGGTSLTIDQLRLIRKHTANLTIIYDGDAAGVKAALRGLDMALEEGLNVKLVLIPENEDPIVT